ncbi:PIN2/TERF1-interacting telomerase inhibitor 1 [Labeo rohita]|uniref:PIN2/TERF1-interacting telomerase inhibitor 1 n=1 Tax=Labeo rohita TaxID=84645 RepID=A0ABQ8LMI9_LABRO|nr:PIN2/TERF1-interacting telomerase inhibitor 1 [Labeo rohita]
MSMLAEPRRKQKWSVDPRNSAWSNDESKFGQKMLERMGWSKGKGLGKTEQGATEHIKVKVKNNNLGLGTAMNNEDNWIAHQDDFNQLLAELNNCHGQNGNDYPTQEQGFSLEEKSKTSKKRVHYMKFTKEGRQYSQWMCLMSHETDWTSHTQPHHDPLRSCLEEEDAAVRTGLSAETGAQALLEPLSCWKTGGKDLSSRSETDLACIFGKRSKRETRDQDEVSGAS